MNKNHRFLQGAFFTRSRYLTLRKEISLLHSSFKKTLKTDVELVLILMCGGVFSLLQMNFNFKKSIPAGSFHYLSFFAHASSNSFDFAFQNKKNFRPAWRMTSKPAFIVTQCEFVH
jgi:hypothetical protein